MKPSARYAKIVEWSDDDECYVGSAPGLISGGCHGDDEQGQGDLMELECQLASNGVNCGHGYDTPHAKEEEAAARRGDFSKVWLVLQCS